MQENTQRHYPIIYLAKKTVWKKCFIPILIFSATILLTGIAASSSRVDPLRAESYSRWDSGHYLSIAEYGYEYFGCNEIGMSGIGCGNAGWFPLYPWLIRLAANIFPIGFLQAGVFFSHLFLFGCIVVIWQRFFRLEYSLHTLLALLLISAFPSGIYYQAIFPISLFVFLALLALDAASQKKFNVAGALAFFAAIAYPPGFLLGIVLASVVIVDRSISLSIRVTKALLLLWMSFFGVLTVSIAQLMSTGKWNAFLLVQQKYGFQPTSPLKHISNLLHGLFSFSLDAQHIQYLFVVFLVFLCITYLLLQKKKIARAEWAIAAYSVLFWVFPITLGGQLSLYRADALLLPLVVLFRRISVPLQGMLLIIAIVLRYKLSILFFQGSLV